VLIDADRAPLGARGWIGDTATGALVAADGTIDWYCPGRFDAPAALFRLLDPMYGGAVRVGLAGQPRNWHSTRPGVQQYQPGTNVLQTFNAGGESLLGLTDLMPFTGPEQTQPARIVRIAQALRGPASVVVEVVPGAAFGPPRKVSGWSEGIAFGGLALRCGLPFEAVPTGYGGAIWTARTTLEVGQRLVVTLDDLDDDRQGPLSVDAAMALAAQTRSAWRSWVSRLGRPTAYAAYVERSALVLRSLTATNGALVEAGTACLPRLAGGERNFDRRAVRLAGAAEASATWRRVGMDEEAEAVQRWLRSAVEGAELPWPGWFGSDGGPAPDPSLLNLSGWRRSQPLQSGIDPDPAPDIDLCGDVLGLVRLGQPLSGAWTKLTEAADWLAEHWPEPDIGLSEAARPAGASPPWPASRLTASTLQAFVALENMVGVARQRNLLDLDAVGWYVAAKAASAALEAQAEATSGVLRRTSEAEGPADAGLLRLAWKGPWPPAHPVVSRTVGTIIGELSDGALLRRYPPGEVDDGRPGTEGPDLTVSLWAVRALAILGEWEEAHRRMEAICALGGSTGLLGETADAFGIEILGNQPYAPAHVALINAALALEAGPD
jgi:hypothetical protein